MSAPAPTAPASPPARRAAAWLAAACLAALAPAAWAEPPTPPVATASLEAPNAAAADMFAASLALAAGTLAVGAPGDDGAGAGALMVGGAGLPEALASTGAENSGAVHVFRQGPDGGWALAAYIKAPAPAAGDWFGGGVALSADGATLAAGAWHAAAVHVYRRGPAGRWALDARVAAPAPGAGAGSATSVALSADGAMLAVGAPGENSAAKGVLMAGDPGLDAALGSVEAGWRLERQHDSPRPARGAVHVHLRGPAGRWALEAYITPVQGCFFGDSLALSADGAALAVGMPACAGPSTGIFHPGDPGFDAALSLDRRYAEQRFEAHLQARNEGAAHVYRRGAGGRWALDAYVKPPGPSGGDAGGYGDEFGASVALSADGATLAVGAPGEPSAARGAFMPGDPGWRRARVGTATPDSGAAYLYRRAAAGRWAMAAFLKPAAAGAVRFGDRLALSADGGTLAASAPADAGSATATFAPGGPGFAQALERGGAPNRGAVHVHRRGPGGRWALAAYVKAPGSAGDRFGDSLALSADGATLAAGARAGLWRASWPADRPGLLAGGGHAPGSGAAWLRQLGGAAPWRAMAPAAAALAAVPPTAERPWPRGVAAYVKAPNAIRKGGLGHIALSADGATLAVSAYSDSSSATGVFHPDDAGYAAALASGAHDYKGVHVYRRAARGRWAPEAYIKPRAASAIFALSADGATLAVGSPLDNSAATGPFHPGDPGYREALASDGAEDSGAVWAYRRVGGRWALEAYLKAPNAGRRDSFGLAVALSADGATLAVGANGDSAAATGPFHPGDPGYREALERGGAWSSGAVHVHRRGPGGRWAPEAYLKAPNTAWGDSFGWRVALSADGAMLAVSARGDRSSAAGPFHPGDPGYREALASNGAQDRDGLCAGRCGAVHAYRRVGGRWALEAYLKPSAIEKGLFGDSLALSADGATLAVGAYHHVDSSPTGAFYPSSSGHGFSVTIGAVRAYRRGADGRWALEAHLKEPKAGPGKIDRTGFSFRGHFGSALALSADGARLAVGAPLDDSAAKGVFRPAEPGWREALDDDAFQDSGAVYLYRRAGGSWPLAAYIKAPNADIGDGFGSRVALSATTLAVGASREDGVAGGVFMAGDPDFREKMDSDDAYDNDRGAVYLYPPAP